MKKFNKKLLLFFLFLFLISFTHTAFAAGLNLSPSSGNYNVGDTIKVRIVLVSSDQSANAVSSSLTFSKNVLTLSSVSKTNSLISLWAQEPSYSNANGTADMEGVILNGYTGSNATILTLFFKAKATGAANIKFTSSSVLANDGQGTNILNSIGQANFNISKAVEKAAAPVNTKVTPAVQIQELKKADAMASSTKFLVTGVGQKEKSSYRVEIDGIAVSWEKQDSGIFETSTLPKGNHTIKVSMDTINDDVVFDSASFSINGLLTPKFTDYLDNIKEKEYIVVKGVADSNMDIVIDSQAILTGINQILDQETIIRSDEKGLFTYVSEKALAGVYDITAYSRTKSGVQSDKTSPVKINVLYESLPISTSIMNTFSLVIPIIALIILLIILAVWGWYKVLRYRENMRKKLTHTKTIVAKSFNILDEDVSEEVKIFKKIKNLQSLTNEERLFINQFKKDIEAAEKVITDDIKEPGR
jgi:hypothetical protein